MFANAIPKWRNPGAIIKITGPTCAKTEKLVIFEQGMDYLASYRGTPKELLHEILGFKETSCKVFHLLSIDNSWLFAKAITREITYYLVVSHLIEQFVNDSKDLKLDTGKFCQWIENNSSDLILKQISLNIVREVQVNDGKIEFRDSVYSILSPFKLTKFERNTENRSIKFADTQKIWRLQIRDSYKKIFYNNIPDGEGLCLGKVKLMLEVFARSYSMDRKTRNSWKEALIKQLEVDKEGHFTDETIREVLIQYRKECYGYDYLKSFLYIYTSLDNFSLSLEQQVNQMKELHIDQTYSQILTTTHALFLAIIVKGHGIKFIISDPNNKIFYSSTTIHQSQLNSEFYRILANKFDYLRQKAGSKICLLIKSYLPKRHPAANQVKTVQLQLISQAQMTQSQAQELLVLSIINHDKDLLTELLRNKIVDPNFRITTFTPLTLAINYRFYDMLDILLQNNANVNVGTIQGKTPLYVALEIFNPESVERLLKKNVEIPVNEQKYSIRQLFKSDASTEIMFITLLDKLIGLAKEEQGARSLSLANLEKLKEYTARK